MLTEIINGYKIRLLKTLVDIPKLPKEKMINMELILISLKEISEVFDINKSDKVMMSLDGCIEDFGIARKDTTQ